MSTRLEVSLYFPGRSYSQREKESNLNRACFQKLYEISLIQSDAAELSKCKISWLYYCLNFCHRYFTSCSNYVFPEDVTWFQISRFSLSSFPAVNKMIKEHGDLFSDSQCKVCSAVLISESQKLTHYQVSESATAASVSGDLFLTVLLYSVV